MIIQNTYFMSFLVHICIPNHIIFMNYALVNEKARLYVAVQEETHSLHLCSRRFTLILYDKT